MSVHAYTRETFLTDLDRALYEDYRRRPDPVRLYMRQAAVLDLIHIAEREEAMIRVGCRDETVSHIGYIVTGYKHPVTGEVVPITALEGYPEGFFEVGQR